MNRNSYIGGSDVAAILGLSKYRTPYDVWESKVNGSRQDDNPAMLWGILLEPVVIKHFEQSNNVNVYDNNKLYTSDVEFLKCHPDGLFMKNGILHLLEVKTVSTAAYSQWDGMPLEYYCQVQHNMYCTGARKAVLAYLVLDSRFYGEIAVDYDEEFVRQQNNYLIEWWYEYVVGKKAPLKVLADYEKTEPNGLVQIEATDEVKVAIDRIKELKEQIKLLEEEKDKLEEQVKLHIGDATDLYDGITLIATWRCYSSARVDTRKLKEEHPDIYLKVAKESKARRFILK